MAEKLALLYKDVSKFAEVVALYTDCDVLLKRPASMYIIPKDWSVVVKKEQCEVCVIESNTIIAGEKP